MTDKKKRNIFSKNRDKVASEAGESEWVKALQRMRRNKLAVASFIVILIIVFLSLFGPWLVSSYNGFNYDTQDLSGKLAAPSMQHPLGTDMLGRDLLVRLLYGGRISLAVAAIATSISLLIGVVYGALAGYFGGIFDEITMRIVDLLYSLPQIVLVVILLALFERSLWLLFIALGAVSWLTIARIVRGQVLSIKNELYVEAARAGGASTYNIITRHIIPNILSPIIVYATLTVPTVILEEAFLSFLGLGVQPPVPSWGVIIREGALTISVYPLSVFLSSSLMILTLLCFNFLGNGLRDAFDPQTREL